MHRLRHHQRPVHLPRVDQKPVLRALVKAGPVVGNADRVKVAKVDQGRAVKVERVR